MRGLLKFLKPMAFLRRKAIYAGLLGGNRKWMAWGGAAWVAHWIGNLFGEGEPQAKYTQEVGAGERIVVLHDPVSPLAAKKAVKADRKAAKKADRKAARASRRAS